MASRWKSFNSLRTDIPVSERVECVRKAIFFAGGGVPTSIYLATGAELSQLLHALVPGLLGILVILAASTSGGALIGAGLGALFAGVGALPGAVLGATVGLDMGIVVLDYLGLAFLAAYIGGHLFHASVLAREGFKEAWDAPEYVRWEQTSHVFRASRKLSEAVGLVFAGILQGVVAYLLAKGTARAAERVPGLVAKLRESKLGAGFATYVENNWRGLIENPRLGGVKPGAQDGGAPFPEEMTPIDQSPSLSKVKFNIPEKKVGQISRRGWTNESIQKTIQDPVKTMKSIDLETNEPATAYFCSDNQYVVIGNNSQKLVQVSNLHVSDWKIPSYFTE
jgi:hypothetical protein